MENTEKTIVEISCPAPLPARDRVLLGHGSGGKLSAELVRDIFLPAFRNPALSKLDDQAVVDIKGSRFSPAAISALLPCTGP
jgi:hydrogenase expression/formation protein HypE